MSSWKENKVVGIIAVVVFILCIVYAVIRLNTRPVPYKGEMPKTPANTPFIK
jgi:hypothetical protein